MVRQAHPVCERHQTCSKSAESSLRDMNLLADGKLDAEDSMEFGHLEYGEDAASFRLSVSLPAAATACSSQHAVSSVFLDGSCTDRRVLMSESSTSNYQQDFR